MMTPLTRLVQVHKAIAHPARIRLLAALRGGPLCVCQMTVLVKLATSTVSEHLSELRKAELITDRKEGRWVEYRLDDSARASGLLHSVWSGLVGDPDLRADEILLQALREVSVDELCGVNLDLDKLDKPKVAAARSRAEKIRGETWR
jgi:ArsR family transcriptional regulator, arsenate/arsenite/antimonite-responsive transcriptional repressor